MSGTGEAGSETRAGTVGEELDGGRRIRPEKQYVFVSQPLSLLFEQL